MGKKSQFKEWEGGVGEGKGQGEKVSIRFFSWAAPKDAGQPGKKRKVWRGLGRQGRRSSLCMLGDRGGESEREGRSPAQFRMVCASGSGR